MLYTEMITTGALLYGDRPHHLAFDPRELPLALQLGGSEPGELAQCSRWAEEYDYSEVNLNVGCPSDRVQSGRFGACLMAEPGRVADCIGAMRDATTLPVTVKHRTGIDQQDSYEELAGFVETVAEAGCRTFIVHARKAWLKGLSPRQNREIPPLQYPHVYQLKRDFSNLEIIINGGIETIEQCQQHLEHVDGVMLGRQAYQHPWLLTDVDPILFGASAEAQSVMAIAQQMTPYIQEHLANGGSLHHITRHMTGLGFGKPGARAFRRHLSENAYRQGADEQVLFDALGKIDTGSSATLIAPG